MKKKITIAIDAMGGENSPDKIIKAVSLFIERNITNKINITNVKFSKQITPGGHFRGIIFYIYL